MNNRRRHSSGLVCIPNLVREFVALGQPFHEMFFVLCKAQPQVHLEFCLDRPPLWTQPSFARKLKLKKKQKTKKIKVAIEIQPGKVT